MMVIFSMTSCNIAQVRNTPVCSVPHADSAYHRNLPAGAQVIDLNTHKVYILTAPVLSTSTLSATQSKTEISNNGLVPVTENGKTGYRLAGVDTALCPNTGNGTVDLAKRMFNNGTLGDYSISMNVYTYSTGNYSLSSGFRTSASGESSCSFGDNSSASGNHASAFNYSTIASGNDASSFGSYTKADGWCAITTGRWNIASGDYSLCGGSGYSTGDYNGINKIASGKGSFNYSHSSVHGSDAKADYSAILGGTDNNINTGAVNSVVLGGEMQSAERSNMVYVPAIKLQNHSSAPANPEGGTVYYGNNRFLGFNGAEWVYLDEEAGETPPGAEPTGFEKVTENGITGWRLIGESPTIKENYTHLNNLEVYGRIDVIDPRLKNNTFIGEDAGISSSGFGSNVAIGHLAFKNNVDGQQNTALGDRALYYGTTGNANTALGLFTLVTNNGDCNTAVGARALNNNGTGNNSTAVGNNALGSQSGTSSKNTAIGNEAGKWYPAVGYNNLMRIYNSVFVGAYTCALNNGDVNEMVFGYNLSGRGSNTATIGNNDITDIYLSRDAEAVTHTGSLRLENTTTPTAASGAIWFDGIHFKGYTGSEWKILDSIGSSSTGGGILPSGLEKITENGKSGWRLIGENADNHGNTGIDAVDLSIQPNAGDFGATGDFAAAMGYNTKASGMYAYAQGNHSEATGFVSYAEGGETEATGNYTHAEGYETQAVGNYSHAGGKGAGWQDEVEATGDVTFVHQQVESGVGTKKAEGDNSAILGGKNNATTATAQRSVVLGGNGQTAIQPDMVYVPAIKLMETDLPAAPESGTVCFDETAKRFKGFNGSEWVNLDSVSPPATAAEAVYAEKYLDSIVQMVAANKNYTVIWAQTGELSGMNTNDSSVTALSDGRYLVNISGSFSMDDPSATVQGWLYKNGVKDTQTGFILDAGANSDASGHYFRACVAANGVVNLHAGDVLTFKVKTNVAGVYRLYVANCSITKL